MTLAPDEDLMLQVRDGAGEMLGVLFDRYQTPLFNFYSKLTGDRTLSEDLVQEVFLRILKYRQSYRPGTPFRAWIYQIARNARVDHFRKFPRQTELEPRPTAHRRNAPGTVRGLLRRSSHLAEAFASSRRAAGSCVSRAF